jgi:hypothetical protein
MHIVIYRDFKADNGPVVVETYHSLNLAVRKAWDVRRNLIQFCIDHPFSDLLFLPWNDESKDE